MLLFVQASANVPLCASIKAMEVAEKRMQPSGGFHSEAFRTTSYPLMFLMTFEYGSFLKCFVYLSVVQQSYAVVSEDSLAARCFCDTAGG